MIRRTAFLCRGKKLKIKETKKAETWRNGNYGRKRAKVEGRKAKSHFQTKPENIGGKKNERKKNGPRVGFLTQ